MSLQLVTLTATFISSDRGEDFSGRVVAGRLCALPRPCFALGALGVQMNDLRLQLLDLGNSRDKLRAVLLDGGAASAP
jgi:hypothetical protein